MGSAPVAQIVSGCQHLTRYWFASFNSGRCCPKISREPWRCYASNLRPESSGAGTIHELNFGRVDFHCSGETAAEAKRQKGADVASEAEERLIEWAKQSGLYNLPDSVEEPTSIYVSNLVPCRTCGHGLSRLAKACPNCGCPSPCPSTAKPIMTILMGLAGGAIVGIYLIGAAAEKGSANGQYRTHYQSSPSDYWSSDAERLEWRSKQRLPMTDEDVRYEQAKLKRAADMIRQSAHPVGQ